MELVQPESLKAAVECSHCHEKTFQPLTKNDHHFCCQGCQFVYELLQKNQLNDFYDYIPEEDRANSLKNVKEKKFEYLNLSEYKNKWLTKENEIEVGLFFVEGIHCIACLWILEKLDQLHPSIISSRLNFEESTLTISAKENSNWEEIANLIQKIGYPPHPLTDESDLRAKKQSEDKSLLIKIGIAAACAMNIMLYSISIYSGAKGDFLLKFNLINTFLSLPVVFFSAIPFYKSAFSAIKNKIINIDIPIALAIILGFTLSVFNTLQGSDQTYFDAIATLVFLVLFSRFVLKKAQSFSQRGNNLQSIIESQVVGKYNAQRDLYENVPSSTIKVGDIIKIEASQSIPVNSLLVNTQAKFQTAAITGEAYPKTYYKNDEILSGFIANEEVTLQCLKDREASYLYQMFRKVKENWSNKSPVTQLSDKASKYLVIASFTLALSTLLYFIVHGQAMVGINRFLAIIVITCPCALGLATPLMFAKGLNIATKNGILIKEQATLEKLSHVKNIFLDKTGTLTEGNFQVVNWDVKGRSKDGFSSFELAHWLQKNSNHPIAAGIKNYLSNLNLQFKEISNEVENLLNSSPVGKISGSIYKFESLPSKNSSEHPLVLKEDDKVLAEIILTDPIKKDAREEVEFLRLQNLNIHLLSGDTQQRVNDFKSTNLFNFKNALGDLDPAQKALYVSNYDETLMIGDGVNDTIAFSKADVSATIHGSLEIGLNASDIYFSKPELSLISKAIMISKETMKVIKRNLIFSLAYNIIGAGLAIAGLIGPLFAAIFMPISSLTVTLSCIISTKYLNEINRKETLWKL
ncbi:MAG: heavy metal translocating P-type ATPase [Oligoflexia bacterium]|nr:heavy metal translocating P-type ATPase [Oligoflexia bacterium]